MGSMSYVSRSQRRRRLADRVKSEAGPTAHLFRQWQQRGELREDGPVGVGAGFLICLQPILPGLGIVVGQLHARAGGRLPGSDFEIAITVGLDQAGHEQVGVPRMGFEQISGFWLTEMNHRAAGRV